MKTGRYRHYKGKLYYVIGLAKHSESEEEHVVYQAMYGKRDMWIRPKAMFFETVVIDGTEVPRFEYIDD